MKCKKFLALFTLCAVLLPTGVILGEEPLITDISVEGSTNGTTADAMGQIIWSSQGTGNYLANVTGDDVTYASISLEHAEDVNITFTPEGLEADKFFAIADNREVAVQAAKEQQSETTTIKFNYIPQTKEYATQAVAVIGKEFTLDMNELFADKDGDDMTFSYVQNDEEMELIEGNVFAYTPNEIGTDNFVFYAQDNGTAADSRISPALFRFSVNVQNDALISQLSFDYPGVTSISLSPAFEPTVTQYILNIPDDIPYVVPIYASGEAEKCFIDGKNNVNSVSTDRESFVITYQEEALVKEYTFVFNHVPKYVGDKTINIEHGSSVTIPLDSLFTDMDGDELTITASEISGAKTEDGNWIFSPTADNQATEVTFTADDGKAKTKQTVALNVIEMDSTMLQSLSIETSDKEDGAYVELPFTVDFLPNQYSYVFEVDETTSYGKLQATKVNEETEIQIEMKSDSSASIKLELDTPFSIPIRDNASITITLTDNSAEPVKTQTYTILFNRPPGFYTTFPDSIDGIATGQEMSLEYEGHVYDYESSRAPELMAYDVATGSVLGSTDINDDDQRVWKYTPTADGTVNVRFVITDTAGSTAEKIVPITAETDTQAPQWGTDKISLRATSSTTVEVRWPRPSDNDVDINGTGNIPNIVSYTVYYRKSRTVKEWSVVVNAGIDIERRTTVRNLSPGTKYEFYVTAVDRSGNVSEASPISEVTTPSGSSGGGSGGGSSSGGGGNSVITPITPTPSPSATPTPATGEFTDMTPEYEWAKTAVTSLAQAGVINGTGEGKFSPGSEVTRADFLVMLFRALDLQYEAADNFVDVPEGSYYYQTIGMAKAMGVATGTGDGMFYPEQSITREDMITLTYRVLAQLGRLPVQPDGQTFGDMEQVSGYAQQPVLVLNANGFIAGDENGNVNPKANTTRSEAAVMIYRIWSNEP